MAINSGSILFFFGAGASAEFGIPTMTKMAKDFRLKIEEHGSEDEKCLYNEIIETLSQDMGSDVDIEAIFSVIDGLKEYNPALVGELALYMIRREFGRSLGDNSPIDLSTLESLESRFRQFVRTSCRLERS